MQVTKEMIDNWLASDNTNETALEALVKFANGEYDAKTFRGDVLSYSDEMTLADIKNWVKRIQNCADDFEVARGLEDEFYANFIAHVARCDDIMLATMAKTVLSTKKIKFARYTA